MNIKETPVTFLNGQDKIFGILHHPLDIDLCRIPMVIFSHGFAGYRIGPHQMFVKMARFLSRHGYSCLRFDFRGRGYSEGTRENTNYQSMISDLDMVIQSVNKAYNPTHVVLLGICSGARTSLYYIKNGKEAIHSLIELSSPLLWQTNELSAATSRTKSVINDYAQKALNLDNWKRLFAGETNSKMIGRIIMNNISNYWQTLKNSMNKKKYRIVHSENFDERYFHNFHGEVLLIHGEKDPESATTTKQIKSLLQKHQIGFEELTIKNANHSFYSLQWENEITESVYNWIKSRFPC